MENVTGIPKRLFCMHGMQGASHISEKRPQPHLTSLPSTSTEYDFYIIRINAGLYCYVCGVYRGTS